MKCLDEVDVLIVGAGAGGSAVAAELASTELVVACIEQGGWIDYSKLPSTSPNWEAHRFSDFNASPNVRKLASDYPINDSDSPISIANYNAVGGSTILYSAHYPRMHLSDFRVETVDGTASDWPISYWDLEPYYERNRTYVPVAGLEGDPAYPSIRNLLPPVPLGPMGEALAKGFNSLGWHWWPSYAAIATKAFGNHNACINLGPCNLGCPQRAKSSADIAYWPSALAAGVELRTGSRAVRVEVGRNGLACGVTYVTDSGETVYQPSRTVVLACNGVGTPRLLLNSVSPAHPQGLANSSDLVGRNLMLHPLGYAEGFFETELESGLGPQGVCMASHEFVDTRKETNFVRGYTMQVLRGPGPAEAAISWTRRRLLDLGVNHYRDFVKRFNRSAHISVIVEDLPEHTNRVTLDPKIKDKFGMPAPRITYKLSRNSTGALSHGLSRAREVLKAAGATKIAAFGPVRATGWHLMGTTRMGSESSTSVVDAWGRAHDCPNLYVADSSVFVTSSSVNPAATIQAWAIRVADCVRRDLSHG